VAKKPGAVWLTQEVAEFLASSPSSEELLAFRPSPCQGTRTFTRLRDTNCYEVNR
jgi:hypothetical protein